MKFFLYRFSGNSEIQAPESGYHHNQRKDDQDLPANRGRTLTAQLNSHSFLLTWARARDCRNSSALNFNDARMLRRENFRVNAESHLTKET